MIRLAGLWLCALAGALLLVGSATPARPQTAEQTASPEPEILVIGQRMRKARLAYDVRGKQMASCWVEVTTGNARIDRWMCAIVALCIREGQARAPQAKRCLDARISAFERRGTVPAGWREMWGDAGVAGRASAEPIRIEPGEWQYFEESITRSRRRHWESRRQWRQCVAPGAQPTQLMLEDPVTLPARGCGPWSVAVDANWLTGTSSCSFGHTRISGSIEGIVDTREVSATKVVRTSARGGETKATSILTGKRVGDCAP